MSTKYPVRIPYQCAHFMFFAFSIIKVIGTGKPSVKMLQEKFGVSRATAYRWVRAWYEANGLQSPAPNGQK